MAYVSAQEEAIDDSRRHALERESLNYHTNRTHSTYDVLDNALAAPTISRTEYSLATLWDAFESPSTMPGSHGGLKPWPNLEIQTQDELNRHAPLSPSAQQGQPRYDAKQQPSYVSQQTSASSVRDMALRKGKFSALRDEERSDTRPLKSALKRYPSEQREVVAHPQFLYPPGHDQTHLPTKQTSRLSRFGSLFSRRSSSNRSIPSPQISRTPSTTSQASIGYAAPTRLQRKRSIGWEQPLQQYDSPRVESAQSAQSDLPDVVRQAKLAEGDVYERAKVNIRRPPKGITNWFDGLDISSDEDDLTPVELPAHEALPSTFTMFSPGRKPAQDDRRSRSKDHQEHRALTKAERVLGQRTGVGRNAHDANDPRRTQPYETNEYIDYRSVTPKASQHNRNRLDTSSGLSNSANSSVEPADTDTDITGRQSFEDPNNSYSSYMYNQAARAGTGRPQIPPRRLQPAQIASHNAYSTIDRPRLLTRDSHSKHSHRSQHTEEDYDDRPSTSRKSSFRTPSDTTKSRGHTSTRMSSSNGYDDSNGGVSLDAMSHMMAVTEEEMALLEMMRNKRAAMQKDSYSEGYRQALRREHEQLMQRRMRAQQTALRILRTQQEDQASQHREEYNMYDGDEKDMRRLKKLKQQEADRTKRLEKFLAMDTSLAAALSDAGIPQDDDLVQDWPLSGEESMYSTGVEAQRSSKPSRTPSFSRRDVYDGRDSRVQRDRTHQPEQDMPLTFPEPPEMRVTPRKQAHNREPATNLVRFEPASSNGMMTQRKGQTLYNKSANQDAAYRHELYMMSSHAAAHTTKTAQPSRQHIQSTTFLRSISDYHPVESDSIASHGSNSVSAGIVSPPTPSSMTIPPGGRVSAMDSRDGEYFNHSSPELAFSRPSNTTALRKTKPPPSSLAVVAETNLSSHRNSMASNNSAGEDVLAAWAELGGNEGMLPSHSRRSRRG